MGLQKNLIAGAIIAVIALVIEWVINFTLGVGTLNNIVPFGTQGVFIVLVALGVHVKEDILKM